METEAKQKLYEMHGTVARLDEKFDKVIEEQGRMSKRVSDNEEDIEQLKRIRYKVAGAVSLASALLASIVTWFSSKGLTTG